LVVDFLRSAAAHTNVPGVLLAMLASYIGTRSARCDVEYLTSSNPASALARLAGAAAAAAVAVAHALALLSGADALAAAEQAVEGAVQQAAAMLRGLASRAAAEQPSLLEQLEPQAWGAVVDAARRGAARAVDRAREAAGDAAAEEEPREGCRRSAKRRRAE
jgi:hypothetical protein